MEQPAGAAAAPQAPKPASGWERTFASLRYPDFRVLWFTSILVAAGIWLQQVTLGWLAYDITRSPFQTAGVIAARTTPLLLTPVAGVLADRLDRRTMLMVDTALISVLVTAFSMTLFFDIAKLWHVYAFAVSFGLLWAVNNPVRQTLVANSVPRESLMNAMALSSMAFNSMRALGPAIGGLLIVLFGPAVNFLLQGIVFLGVFLALFAFHPTYSLGDRQEARSQSVLRNLVGGFSYVAHNPTTLATTLATISLAITALAVVTTQMPVFVAEVLDNDDGGLLGLLLFSLGVGGLIGTVIIARFSHYQRKGLQTLVAFTGTAVCLLVMSQVTVLWAAMVVLMFQQMFTQTVLTTNLTIVQATTPDNMRGRVIGVYQMEIGMTPLGGLIAGTIAGEYGVSNAFLTAGIGALVMIGIFAVFVPSFRRLRL